MASRTFGGLRKCKYLAYCMLYIESGVVVGLQARSTARASTDYPGTFW